MVLYVLWIPECPFPSCPRLLPPRHSDIPTRPPTNHSLIHLQDGRTPLHWASLETARLLLDRGADKEATCYVRGEGWGCAAVVSCYRPVEFDVHVPSFGALLTDLDPALLEDILRIMYSVQCTRILF